MSTRLLVGALLAAAAAFAVQRAHADIYTWVDAAGTVNVSNLEPPSGVRVTSVTHEQPKKNADGSAVAVREAEMQMMKERIRSLELEVELASRPPADYRPAPPDYRPPPVDYRPMPVPVPYASEPMSWPTPYMTGVAPHPYDDCPWNCGLAWGSPIYPIYPPAVVVVRVPARGGHHGHRGHQSMETQPWRVADGLRRR